jgi:hypothetical protein
MNNLRTNGWTQNSLSMSINVNLVLKYYQDKMPIYKI